MAGAASELELFEVFTADQARLLLGTSNARSVSEAARRREVNGGSPVHWDNKDPGNPTAVQLFDANWVRERALDHDGLRAQPPPLVVPLLRRPGMTLSSCRVTVQRGDDSAPLTREMAYRLEESERVLDGYRRQAERERGARLEAEITERDNELVRLRAELARSQAAIGQLTKAVDSLSGVEQP